MQQNENLLNSSLNGYQEYPKDLAPIQLIQIDENGSKHSPKSTLFTLLAKSLSCSPKRSSF